MSLTLSPEYEKLRAEIEKLRIELSMLVLEHDELRLVECKNIEMRYMLELGGLEYKTYKAYCTYLRLKRKIELIQAKINRQEIINTTEIEEYLDTEFEKYEKELNERIQQINEAIDWKKGKFLSQDETEELKKLYRKIVKALHPDLHPGISNEQIALFARAMEAYDHGDLETIRIISDMVSDQIIPETNVNAIQEMELERERLNQSIETIKKRIQTIKNSYPYTMKELLQDQEKLSEKRKELENILTQYQDVIAEYQKTIEKMVG